MVNPPASVNVGACDCPGGIPNVTTTFCAFVAVVPDGIVNSETTVPAAVQVALMP